MQPLPSTFLDTKLEPPSQIAKLAGDRRHEKYGSAEDLAMIVAAVAVVLDLLLCAAVGLFFRHCAMQRAECPRCLGHDTKTWPGGDYFCRDCETYVCAAVPDGRQAA